MALARNSITSVSILSYNERLVEDRGMHSILNGTLIHPSPPCLFQLQQDESTKHSIRRTQSEQRLFSNQ